MAEIFESFDIDNSGTIDRKEISDAIRRVLPDGTNVDENEIDNFIKTYDKDGDQKLDLNEFRRLLFRLSHRGSVGNMDKTSVAFMKAVAMERSKLGEVATTQVNVLRVVVPVLLALALIIIIYAGFSSEIGIIKKMADAFAAPEQWPVRVTVVSAISATVVIGFLVKDHLEEKNEHSALTIAICAMVPLYAWASAIKVCLPNDYEMVKSVLEAAKECCKDSYLLGKTLYMHTTNSSCNRHSSRDRRSCCSPRFPRIDVRLCRSKRRRAYSREDAGSTRPFWSPCRLVLEKCPLR